MFNKHTRVHNDSIIETETDFINRKKMNYTLDSIMQSNADANVALQEPDVHYFGANVLAKEIDVNSKLLLDESQFSIDHNKATMNKPTFAVMPYKGKGPCNPEIESILKKGEDYRDKKYFTKVNENRGMVLKEYPLLNNVRDTLAKPSNFVESPTSKEWSRGGLPTREMSKY